MLQNLSSGAVVIGALRVKRQTLTLCPSWKFFMFFSRLLIFFKNNFLEKFFQEYHLSVKQIGIRSGLAFCQAWSGSKLFAKQMTLGDI